MSKKKYAPLSQQRMSTRTNTAIVQKLIFYHVSERSLVLNNLFDEKYSKNSNIGIF